MSAYRGHDAKVAALAALAEEAVVVQDACNLSGVVHSYSRAVTKLRELGLDTDAINRHPVCILYASKVSSLTGAENGTTFGEAYLWAKTFAGPK